MGKRQESALETKKKIIVAMRSLMEEKSADQIGIEDITTRAGVAKGSFYTYFKRKEDVISVVALECYDGMKGSAGQSAGDVHQQLSSYLMDSARIIDKNTLQIAQNWMKSVVAPINGEHDGAVKYHFDCDNIKEILEQAVLAGELGEDTPVEIMAEQFVNYEFGTVAVWCITGGKTDLVESMDRFCRCGLKEMLQPYKKTVEAENA